MTIEQMLEDIQKQFGENQNGFGEPQAWISLPNGRSIEITLEQEGLSEEEYYYSVRLYRNEEEINNYNLKTTCGIIESYCSDNEGEHQLEYLLTQILLCNDRIK